MDYQHFDEQAWSEHGEAPEAVAQGLPAGAALVATPAQAGACARLVAHVLGEHLGRWQEALALLARLAPRAAGDAASLAVIGRQTAALRWAAGDTAVLDALAPADRIAALALAASMLAGGSGIQRGLAAYAEAEALAADGLADGSPALRALAAAGNNVAASLGDRADRTPAQTAGMLRAADAALRWWRRAGTWLEEERAHWRLARCRLSAGDGAGALQATHDGLLVCAAHDAPAFERFFLYVVQAQAAHALHDGSAAAAARQAALAAFDQVDADERRWCTSGLEVLRCTP
jgi:hypothetical protein